MDKVKRLGKNSRKNKQYRPVNSSKKSGRARAFRGGRQLYKSHSSHY